MRFAETPDGRKIEPTKSEVGFCSYCKAELSPRMGEVNSWYWAHRSEETCAAYKRYTSSSRSGFKDRNGIDWRNEWISYYHKINWEVMPQNIIADALNELKKIALLLVHTAHHEEVISFLNQAYELNYTPILIFHKNAFQSFEIEEHAFIAGEKRGKATRETFLLRLNQSYIRGGHPPKPDWFWLDLNGSNSFEYADGMYRLTPDSYKLIIDQTPEQHPLHNSPSLPTSANVA